MWQFSLLGLSPPLLTLLDANPFLFTTTTTITTTTTMQVGALQRELEDVKARLEHFEQKEAARQEEDMVRRNWW